MRFWVTTLILLCSCVASANAIDYVCTDPVVETRAMWIDAGAMPKTNEGIRQMVRAYREANINLLFPEVIARGYTVYPSKLLARDPRFADAPDVLATIIREAHALGMEVHPWVWVFRAGYTKDKGAILGAHPDWAELSRDGKELSPNGGYWISPVVPEARNFLAELFAELVREYDVDGLHLDYIRYESEASVPYGYSEISRDVFRKRNGMDPLDIDRLSIQQYDWLKFRERQINTFVQRIALQTRSLKPNAKVSAAVGCDPKTARLQLMQDWVNWVDNKWVDFIVPMAYSTDDGYFRRLVELQTQAVGRKTVLVPGIGFYTQKEPAQMVSQIAISRELGGLGQALFAASHYKEGHSSALAEGPYVRPAEQPFRDPMEKSRRLCDQAARLSEQGKPDEAGLLRARADILEEYAKYLAADTPYVAPSPPPLEIPEFVVPLPAVDVPKTDDAIRIDGKIDDDAWRSAATVKLLYTNRGQDAPVETTALITYDASSLYVAFDCAEPEPGKIKAEAGRRDGPTFYDDSVELFIDPSDRRADYFHLSVNAIETRFDQRKSAPGWNGEWRAAAKVGEAGWVAEIAIPFSTLGVAEPTAGAQWALNLARNRTTAGSAQHLTWAVPYGSLHTPDRFGRIAFR